MPPLLRRLAPPVAVLLLGLAAYANSHRGDFVYDDLAQIRDNPALRDPFGMLLGSAPGSVPPNRIVGYLTFAANLGAGGLAVAGWHAVNLAVHLASALLLYLLVLQLLAAPRLEGSGLSAHAGAIAFSTSALFVSHPIQTQAVSYVVQRLTSLAAMLYLGTAVAWLAWRRNAGAARYAVALTAALLALRTKEIAFTLPLALLLVERLAFGPLDRRRWLALAPFALAAMLIPLSVLRSAAPAGQIVGDTDQIARVQTGMGRLDYLRNQAPVVAGYLRLLAWPEGQSVDHDPPVETSWLAPRVLQALLLHAVLALAAAGALWRSRSSDGADPAWRLVALGIIWFYLTLAVESSLVPIVDLMVEHRVYLPSAGALLAALMASVLLLQRLLGRLPVRALVAATTACSLALGFATLLRNRVWFTSVSLWQDAALKAPRAVRPQLNLGMSLAEGGQFAAALDHLRLGVRLAPDLAYGHAQLGSVLLGAGLWDEAEAELRETLRLEPGDLESLFNLAELLFQAGRREEARLFYARFVDTAPPVAYAGPRARARARLR